MSQKIDCPICESTGETHERGVNGWVSQSNACWACKGEGSVESEDFPPPTIGDKVHFVGSQGSSHGCARGGVGKLTSLTTAEVVESYRCSDGFHEGYGDFFPVGAVLAIDSASIHIIGKRLYETSQY